MMKRHLTKFVKYVLTVAVLAGGFLFVSMPSVAQAASLPNAGVPLSFALTQNQQDVCDAIGSGTDCTKSKGTDVNNVIAIIVNLLSGIVGVVAVIMIVVSGFKYITSGGDSAKVSSAKGTLVYAIVGLVIVALAQFIVRFVLNKTV